MTIEIEQDLCIELIEEVHAQQIYDVVDDNRAHLREWLPFVDKMQGIEFAENFVRGTMKRNLDGNEFAFVIVAKGKVVGRIGVYKIDAQNRVGELGYWLAEGEEGKGIVTKACQSLIAFCFADLNLNRIEIRCGVQNLKSKLIAERLNFSLEGILRQGEFLYDKFIDLNLYSLLKEEKK